MKTDCSTDDTARTRGEIRCTVRRSETLGQAYRSLFLGIPREEAPFLATARPGQFVQIACRPESGALSGPIFLRRPFSMASAQVSDREVVIEIIHNIIGPGTAWLASRREGDPVFLLGPLGNGFTLPDDKTAPVILIGGGVGIPPVLFLADVLKAAGFTKVLGIAGMRSAGQFDQSIESVNSGTPELEPASRLRQFTRSGTPSLLATDDGSCGFAGNAVAAANGFLESNPDWQTATIFACGPDRMLHATAELTQRRSMAGQLCMEAYMACGFGVCQSCVVPVKVNPELPASEENSRYALTCDAGPVFDSRTIIWE